ncbi:MAG: lipase maturation factor family protein [bacterium]
MKPLMIYDGDCGFCRKWIARWKMVTGNSVEYGPYQEWARRFPEIPETAFQKSIHLMEPDGRVTWGAEAVFRSLAYNRFLGWLPVLYEKIPGLAAFSEGLYRWVADHRSWLSRGASCGLSQADQPATYRMSRWAFLKVLALCNFFAFFSLKSQIGALIGTEGIEPVLRYLTGGTFETHIAALGSAPTLLWFCPTDGFLKILCDLGMISSTVLFFDFLPFICLVVLWISYLSLITVGGDFLSFQWDNLLLECDALAVFLVPLGFRLRRENTTSIPGFSIFMMKWLLFRLMVSSGMVKLLSGDPTWRDWTALSFHYETQPLPTPLAWWAQQLPLAFQRGSCGMVFLVELAVPFLLWAPRRWRSWAFAPLAIFQILIALTGNYCFFNLLTVGLCFFALEDEAWPLVIRKKWARKFPQNRPGVYFFPLGRGFLLTAILFLSCGQFFATMGFAGWEKVCAPLEALAAPFRSVNRYGLFAVMTTQRREIIIEGSADGKTWKPYEFRYKPGDLSRATGWIEPLQPRLDWQMWFAALEPANANHWFIPFLIRILQGSKPVLALLKSNPFPETPPHWIRAKIWDYRFTDPAVRDQTGQWWRRDNPQIYVPPFALSEVK